MGRSPRTEVVLFGPLFFVSWLVGCYYYSIIIIIIIIIIIMITQ